MAHLPLKKLLAYHYDKLSSAEKALMQEHLDDCGFCSENLTRLVQPEQTLKKISPAKTGTRVTEMACLSPETIGKYINHELPSSKMTRAEKHLAACAGCRQQLIKIAQICVEPVSEEEKKILAALPPFEISEQIQKIFALMPKNKPASRLERLAEWIYPHIPELVAAGRARNLALVAGILLITILAGYQPFRNWRAGRHADIAMMKLQNAWTITDEALRPAADFRQSLFSQTHSAEETPGADTVEIEFQQALQWNKSHRQARLGFATYLLFTGNLSAADSLFTLLLQENPRDFEAWNNLGLVSAQREDSAAALANFEKALQIQPAYAIAAYNRADLLHLLSRREEAKLAWEYFLKLDAQSKWAEAARRRWRDLSM